jgi:hypothetical protein
MKKNFGIILANSKIKNMFKSKKIVNETIGVWGGGVNKFRQKTKKKPKGFKKFEKPITQKLKIK